MTNEDFFNLNGKWAFKAQLIQSNIGPILVLVLQKTQKQVKIVLNVPFCVHEEVSMFEQQLCDVKSVVVSNISVGTNSTGYLSSLKTITNVG